MKSFIWRMRSNFGYFLAAMTLFAVIYVIIAYKNVRLFPNSGMARCLDGIDPTIVSACVCFAFFFICAKRYTYDEAYLYGQSRKGAFLSGLSSAFVYASVFACYALGIALLVRRAILSSPGLVVSANLYDVTAVEVFFNFLYLVTVNMIAYETANLLRKFKSWKFWIVFAVCIATFAVLYIFIVVLPQSRDIAHFNYWSAIFSAFIPQLIIMILGDFLIS